jgi:hypothetical protein
MFLNATSWTDFFQVGSFDATDTNQRQAVTVVFDWKYDKNGNPHAVAATRPDRKIHIGSRLRSNLFGWGEVRAVEGYYGHYVLLDTCFEGKGHKTVAVEAKWVTLGFTSGLYCFLSSWFGFPYQEFSNSRPV